VARATFAPAALSCPESIKPIVVPLLIGSLGRPNDPYADRVTGGVCHASAPR
jgi:hypothetical protein